MQNEPGGTSSPVSVIIPSLGRYRELSAAILSADGELGAGSEILVVDDGSSPPIEVAGLPATRSTLRLLRSDRNVGPASARNLGLTAARNEIIAFLDSDDLWLPGKLSAQLATLASAPGELVAVACGWQETEGGAVTRRRMPRPSVSRSDFFAGCWFCPGSTLVLKHGAIDICGSFAEGLRRLEDLEWFLRFAKAGGKLLVADVIGASIARGGNARPQAVEAAAEMIRQRHMRAGGASRGEAGDLAAYLDIERAAAYANVSRRGKALFHGIRSLSRRPRLSVPLRAWWTTRRPSSVVPHD